MLKLASITIGLVLLEFMAFELSDYWAGIRIPFGSRMVLQLAACVMTVVLLGVIR
jgi:hypothetical protein